MAGGYSKGKERTNRTLFTGMEGTRDKCALQAQNERVVECLK